MMTVRFLTKLNKELVNFYKKILDKYVMLFRRLSKITKRNKRA